MSRMGCVTQVPNRASRRWLAIAIAEQEIGDLEAQIEAIDNSRCHPCSIEAARKTGDQQSLLIRFSLRALTVRLWLGFKCPCESRSTRTN